MASGEDIKRETVVRWVSEKYVAFGRRAREMCDQGQPLSGVARGNALFNNADTTANKVASKILPS
jgi:hypothetical protein